MTFSICNLDCKNIQRIRTFLLAICFGAVTLPAYADTTPPRIIHDIISSEVAASQPYEFSATVTDDEAVAEVLFNYKHQESAEFKSIPMEAKAGSADYTATIPAGDLVAPGLDYFISATDASGNNQFRGFDFDPLQLSVFAPVTLQSNSEEKSGTFGKRKIWYVVGAVALLGAGLAASGGSDSSPDSETGTTVFVLER